MNLRKKSTNANIENKEFHKKKSYNIFFSVNTKRESIHKESIKNSFTHFMNMSIYWHMC